MPSAGWDTHQNQKEQEVKNILSLDLEHNNRETRSIIEIGVTISTPLGEEITAKSWLVRLPTGETVNPEIEELTGISQKMLDEQGVGLQTAYNELVALHKEHDCFINVMTWGHGDMALLKEQVFAIEGSAPEGQWPFGRRIIDVKTVYGAWRMAHMREPTGGLKAACRKLGIPFDGRAHRATDDARNTVRVFHTLAKKLRTAAPYPERSTNGSPKPL